MAKVLMYHLHRETRGVCIINRTQKSTDNAICCLEAETRKRLERGRHAHSLTASLHGIRGCCRVQHREPHSTSCTVFLPGPLLLCFHSNTSSILQKTKLRTALTMSILTGRRGKLGGRRGRFLAALTLGGNPWLGISKGH